MTNYEKKKKIKECMHKQIKIQESSHLEITTGSSVNFTSDNFLVIHTDALFYPFFFLLSTLAFSRYTHVHMWARVCAHTHTPSHFFLHEPTTLFMTKCINLEKGKNSETLKQQKGRHKI